MQDAVEIHVLQGERQFAKDNKSLGIFKLKGIPPAPRGVPKINVTFQLDVNGLLSVSAREEQTGQEQSIKIEGASTLSREEVSKMMEEAKKNSILDQSRKSILNIAYELDNYFLYPNNFYLGLCLNYFDLNLSCKIPTRSLFQESLVLQMNSSKKQNCYYKIACWLLEWH
jgi:hypothetical protein